MSCSKYANCLAFNPGLILLFCLSHFFMPISLYQCNYFKITTPYSKLAMKLRFYSSFLLCNNNYFQSSVTYLYLILLALRLTIVKIDPKIVIL